MSPEPPPLDFRDFEGFFDWLTEHHDGESGARLFIYKKGYRDQGIAYEDAVRAALCWGWIDSTTWRHDERRFIQRFTPRKRGSNWSASNIRRMIDLLDRGRVTDAGLAVFDCVLIDRLGEVEAAERARREAPAVLPDVAAAILAEEPDVGPLFEALPPSHRRNYCTWIADAKREDTRVRRTRKMIEMLRQGRPISEL